MEFHDAPFQEVLAAGSRAAIKPRWSKRTPLTPPKTFRPEAVLLGVTLFEISTGRGPPGSKMALRPGGPTYEGKKTITLRWLLAGAVQSGLVEAEPHRRIIESEPDTSTHSLNPTASDIA